MSHFAFFMDMFGHCELTLSMVRSILNVTTWSQEELNRTMQLQNTCIKKSWYKVAVYYKMTTNMSNTLRTRCNAENAMRRSWKKFQSLHVQGLPEVPPLPEN
jgi:hypothetical protein